MVKEDKEHYLNDMKSDSLFSSNPSPSDNNSHAALNQVSVKRTTGPIRRPKEGGWTEEEDKLLIDAVREFNGKNWRKIAMCLPCRTAVQCLHRWQKVLNPELVKGAWTEEEDGVITEMVEKLGNKKWSEIAKFLPGRIGKQCRERWHNHLNPAIKKTPWTEEEVKILIEAHSKYGNCWAEIAKTLPGRTENSIKNHWNSSVRKRLMNSPHINSDSRSCRPEAEVVKQSLGQEVNFGTSITLDLNMELNPETPKHVKLGRSGTMDSSTLDLTLETPDERVSKIRQSSHEETCFILSESSRSNFHERAEQCNESINGNKPLEFKDHQNNFSTTDEFPSSSLLSYDKRFSSSHGNLYVVFSKLKIMARSFKNKPSIIRKGKVRKYRPS